MVAGMEIQPTALRPIPIEPEVIARRFLSSAGWDSSAVPPGGPSGAAAMASDVVDCAFREFWSAYICQRSPLLAKLSEGGRRGYGSAKIEGIEIAEKLEHGATGIQLSEIPVTVRAPLAESSFLIPFTQTEMEMSQDCRSVAGLAATRALELMNDITSYLSRAMFGSFSLTLSINGLPFGGNGIVGLQNLVPDTGHGKAMEMDSDDFSFWRNQVINLNYMGKPTNQASLLDAMNQMSEKIYDENGETDIIVTTKHLYTVLGCKALDFETTDVVWDEFCPKDRMYFLNSKTLNLRASDRINMTRLVHPPPFHLNPLAWVVGIGWIGQTFMINRQSQGVIIV